MNSDPLNAKTLGTSEIFNPRYQDQAVLTEPKLTSNAALIMITSHRSFLLFRLLTRLRSANLDNRIECKLSHFIDESFYIIDPFLQPAPPDVGKHGENFCVKRLTLPQLSMVWHSNRFLAIFSILFNSYLWPI